MRCRKTRTPNKSADGRFRRTDFQIRPTCNRPTYSFTGPNGAYTYRQLDRGPLAPGPRSIAMNGAISKRD